MTPRFFTTKKNAILAQKSKRSRLDGIVYQPRSTLTRHTGSTTNMYRHTPAASELNA